MVKALITGCAGQDGSYLAELLLEKGYTVIGIVRRTSSTKSLWRLQKVLNHKRFILEEGDVTDMSCIFSLFSKHKPDEIYNLAAQSHVFTSFHQPDYTWRSVYSGCLNCLESIRILDFPTRFYQASSSEQFGANYSLMYTELGRRNHDANKYNEKIPSSAFQDEETPFNPQSPYAIAKVAAHQLTELYRKSYGIYASAGILNNHESVRRGEKFVTQKVARYIRELHNKKLSNVDFLRLGNLRPVRDWCHAKDMVRGMWLILQQPEPDTFVLGSGVGTSVEKFIELAFNICCLYWPDFVKIDTHLFRPSDVPYLRANCNKAKSKLGWEPKITLEELIEEMISGKE